MKRRKLGELEVSVIGLGCMGMSAAYGERDEAGSIATVNRALDRGVTFLDTADVYGNGHNEELLGRALKTRRREVTLATKFGNIRTPEGKRSVNGTPDYVIEACEKSLRRLNTDVIDLYYVHRIDPKVSIEDTIAAMARFVEQGKVRHIGLSEASPETIRRAHATHPVTALQTEYSLWTRDVEQEILTVCRELNIGFVAYSPLGRGFLSGTITSRDALIDSDRRRDHPRFTEQNIASNRRLVDTLRSVGDETGASPAQIALAWLLTRGPDVVPIPGTKKVKWLDENLAAVDLSLSSAQIAMLEAAFEPGAASGGRYPPEDMKRVGI